VSELKRKVQFVLGTTIHAIHEETARPAQLLLKPVFLFHLQIVDITQRMKYNTETFETFSAFIAASSYSIDHGFTSRYSSHRWIADQYSLNLLEYQNHPSRSCMIEWQQQSHLGSQ
jgi:hypothetical protein